MKKNISISTRIIFTLFFIISFSAFSFGQTTTIDFEVAGNGYTPSTTVGSTFTDVFNRINPNIGGNSTFIWGVEDLPVTNPSITLDQISVSGASSFTFSIDMIAHHFNDWDDNDELLITYSIDGGAYQNLMWVQNTGAQYNQTASLDTNFDGDGECGAGLTLPSLTTGTSGCTASSNTFETFTTSSIALSGNSTLDIKLQFNQLTSTDEGIYLDNIVITQVSSTPNPEIQTQIPSGTDVACGYTYDFGTQTTGSNTNQTLRIKNIGTANLNISSYPLSGTNAGEFSISPASTNPTITAGSTYDITVTFSPTTTGSKSAEITINSDDTDEGTCIINLIGNAIAPCITPTAQPTGLDLSTNITTTSIEGNFTAASPPADSYLVVYSTSNSLSSNPADGTTYVSGDALGGGIVVGNISGTNFTANGLTSGTEYYFFIFANNNASCSGGPLYNITNPLTGNEITIPDTVNWTTPGCISNSTIELNWDAAPGNSTGYLLVVREGAIPHVITGLDPTTNLSENLDYSLAAQFGSTTEYSRILYKGAATSVTVIGLPTTNCTFKIYTYTIGSNGTDYVYSSGTQQTNIVNLDNVSSETASCSDSQSSIAWSNPTSSCFDEVLVVANETAGIDFIPSGDGTGYTANTIYAGIDQVVYKGTGNNVTVTNLTNGITYYFEIFTRKGTEWSSGIEVSCTPNTMTILYPGDLAIIAVNTNILNGCDELAFFCFKDITPGTKIVLTDNGYEREYASFFGGTEGVVSITRTGSTIEKGTVIVFQSTQAVGNVTDSSHFDMYSCGVIDKNWTKEALAVSGIGGFNLNSDDDVWIMQGGNWINSTSHYSTYDGNVLYGWTESGWDNAPGGSSQSTRWSTLFSGAECFNTVAPVGAGKVKFFSDTSITRSQANWIGEINTTINWDSYADNTTYNAGGLDYFGSCIKFHIDNSLGNGAGMWQGGEDNNWFNCANWLNMQVPDQTIDVTILSSAYNEANIDDTQEDATIYGPIAKCKNLTIQNGGDSIYVQIDDANDELQVLQNLTLESNGQLFNDNGGTLTVEGNLSINDSALIDIHANPTAGSTINIKGNWIDNNLVDNDTLGLFETGGLVIFAGTSTQSISDATGNESFFDLKMNNTSGLDLNGNDLSINGTLDLTLGQIITGSTDTLIVNNTSTTAIINPSTSSYVNGNLRRYTNAIGSYNFPVGTSLQYELATIIFNSSTGINYMNANFNTPFVTTAISPLGLTINSTPLVELLNYGFWTIHPDNITYTVDYDVIVTSQGHTNGGSDPAQHTIVKRADASVDWVAYELNHNNATQSGTGINPITAQLSGLTAFSDFAIAKNTQFPLPISLAYVKADCKNKIVGIEWATTSEINNAYFTVEKTQDYRKIEQVTTVLGGGNTNVLNTYSALDLSPYLNTSYYRIKQNDFDGTSTYSNWVAVNNSSLESPDIIVSYRPLENILYIENINTGSSIRIVDIQGRVILKEDCLSDQSEHKIKLSKYQLPKGVYMVSIILKSDLYTQKFVIQ